MYIPQLEEIKMSNVNCNIVTHQPKIIDALCLSPQCQENATLCSKCVINSHPQCRQYVNDLDVIPKQLMELQQQQFDILLLQERINQQFKELFSKIASIFVPISEYRVTPNLTNLNQIGSLLRTNPKQTIFNLIDETKAHIRLLLENQNIIPKQQVQVKVQLKQAEVQMQVKVKEEIPKQDANFWFNQGRSLEQLDKYIEAIDCFDQAIKINPTHYQSFKWKGISLEQLDKYIEAIDCFDQAIKINPTHHDSFFEKGISLFQLKKYIEAIDCIDQAIKIDPEDYLSFNIKGKMNELFYLIGILTWKI